MLTLHLNEFVVISVFRFISYGNWITSCFALYINITFIKSTHSLLFFIVLWCSTNKFTNHSSSQASADPTSDVIVAISFSIDILKTMHIDISCTSKEYNVIKTYFLLCKNTKLIHQERNKSQNEQRFTNWHPRTLMPDDWGSKVIAELDCVQDICSNFFWCHIDLNSPN